MQKITIDTIEKLEAAESMGMVEARTVLHELFQRAFDLVCNPNDWRAPIDKTIWTHETSFAPDFIAYAVQYMTATECMVSENQTDGTRFRADGYRNGPAGP